ncbi:hypothetical protein COZ78_02800 [bacterium (Candidatus Gribaldobacteria) CG_4_8_14_3_um_filter_42_11]|uniref:Methyltransferase n=2 Tax=Candidatus Gribaldobacteria TaxID=2798536 RepID=A0A2M7IXU0_9BACT|nr:MAG: hypothetical protein COS21_02725 [bacterium (Candidatus Gribaldobacteria) CG02_land_8_20_14_3_00_41_15]PIX02990.1 MAG: hypothetical protein COZ78_02800 [bacterium (Candidatus Gribaldobacteria) CG_4_8_14_3_um_filter_42_11]
MDDIRVPQLVELEHRKRCENVPSVINGKFFKTKFNDKGKNPGDVWDDIKQLTYKSKELVGREFLNTIQKPVKLIERIIKASSKEGDLVLDPFAGLGTTFVACKNTNRNFIGFEINQKFVDIANKRIGDTQQGKIIDLFSLLSQEWRQSKMEKLFIKNNYINKICKLLGAGNPVLR